MNRTGLLNVRIEASKTQQELYYIKNIYHHHSGPKLSKLLAKFEIGCLIQAFKESVRMKHSSTKNPHLIIFAFSVRSATSTFHRNVALHSLHGMIELRKALSSDILLLPYMNTTISRDA